MRLRIRSRAGRSADPVSEVSERAPERGAPPSAVTSWLRQGLKMNICPLCRVAHKADREYMWHFFDEAADRGESIDELRRACGFCSEHIEMLRRIEVDGMKSTLGISVMFAETLAGVLEDLETLNPRGQFERAACPACAHRDEQLRANAQYLLDELATSPGRRGAFEASRGLCFSHFALTWSSAQSSAERELILSVQREATRRLLGELREHIRKQDDRFRHEPKGLERDSWERAIFLTVGWSPPSESAAEPESG